MGFKSLQLEVSLFFCSFLLFSSTIPIEIRVKIKMAAKNILALRFNVNGNLLKKGAFRTRQRQDNNMIPYRVFLKIIPK